MCSSRKILWSLLLLSVLEVGLGVASIVLGAVGISWVRGEHKPQQGDASPVWSGLCKNKDRYVARIGVTGAPPWSQAWGWGSQASAWWPGLCPRDPAGLSPKWRRGPAFQ
ncbi:hypothetical protein L3Q82_014928 [Scortum barcoo]|uniref:Uncharacterized protein n=1 Tax=Scortum barcoo TaxID=214431 RepID=A0ACB8VSC0_9TELE|nr:hypothetical protein L3Q82_014928 [Scortum barcoo]